MIEPPKCVDLFCGAGGLSLGFIQAGFSNIASNDFDSCAANTMKESHPDAKFLDGKIQDISASDILRIGGIKKGQLDCLVGGPPCQAYSVYNHQRGMHDARSGLFREYLRMVEGLHPKFLVIENVTGIQSIDDGVAVKEIESRLTEFGYKVKRTILKAEQYGVPQERRRLFFVANRLGIDFEWPEPTHSDSKGLMFYKPFVNVEDAILDLPELKILGGAECQQYTSQPASEYQQELRGESIALFNHVAPFLAPINEERLKYIPQGGSWRNIPEHLLPAGMKRARRCDHTKRYGRLHPKGLASTILTKCDLHWGAFIHPTQNRTLTVREAARLQSFPDYIKFCGPRSEQFRQVGNAVPPKLARAVAERIIQALKSKKTKRELVNAI